VFFAVAPGTVVGLGPWLVTRWSFGHPPTPVAALRIAVGAVLIAPGLLFLVRAFVRFVVEGIGTPLPAAPTEHLVVGGVYRYVRNPMYVAILTALAGQAVVFASWRLVVYAAVIAAMFTTFVRGYEQPTLRRTYGAEYDRFCANVPGWIPQLHPWDPTA
jgi:protein-S-isoprenylcysteine O-methyltransferase Ste14